MSVILSVVMKLIFNSDNDPDHNSYRFQNENDQASKLEDKVVVEGIVFVIVSQQIVKKYKPLKAYNNIQYYGEIVEPWFKSNLFSESILSKIVETFQKTPVKIDVNKTTVENT